MATKKTTQQQKQQKQQQTRGNGPEGREEGKGEGGERGEEGGEEEGKLLMGRDGRDQRDPRGPKKSWFRSEVFTDSVLFLPRNKDISCVLPLVMQLFCFLGYLSEASPNISYVSYRQ